MHIHFRRSPCERQAHSLRHHHLKASNLRTNRTRLYEIGPVDLICHTRPQRTTSSKQDHHQNAEGSILDQVAADRFTRIR